MSEDVCAHIWNAIRFDLPTGAKPKHLLYGLLFMKVYSIEHVHANMVGCDEKTFQKWAWVIIKCLSKMNTVRL